MDINTLAVIGGIAVIGLLIFRLLMKTGMKLVGGTFIFGVVVIAVLVGSGKLDLHNFHASVSDFKFMDMDKLYCGEQGIDKVICDCIVKPLDEKIQARYTPKEIEDLKSNKMNWLREVYSILKEHKGDFQKRLQEQGQEKKWDEFLNQFVGVGLDKQTENAFDELKDPNK
jgi:hypothetical protein